MRQCLALLAIWAMSSTIYPGVAAAQDPSQDAAQAEALNAEGKKLIRQLDLEGAAQRFRQANQLVPDPRYAFNLCYTLEKSGKFAEAQLACNEVEASNDVRLAAKAKDLLVSIEENLAARPTPGQPDPRPVDIAPPRAGPPVQPVQPIQPIGMQTQPVPSGGYVQQFPGPPQRRTRSYMNHVLMADSASWSILLLAGAVQSEELAGFGVAGLILGGATVHFGHGNTRGAMLSIGARTGMPLLGALAFSSSCDGYGCIGSLIAGGVLGYGGAVMLDWFVFAKKTEYVYPNGQLVLQPTLDLGPGRAVAGLLLQL